MTATSDKKTAKREKWNRAVSKKFYEFIHCQICHAKEVSDDEEVRVNVMMDRFDEYIEKGTVKVDFNNTEYVVFAMLQPYIDQAVARSHRARQAAARRRAARQAAETPKSELSESTGSPISAPMTVAQDKTDDLKAEVTPTTVNERKDRDVDVDKRAKRRKETKLRRQQKHDKRIQSRPKANKPRHSDP